MKELFPGLKRFRAYLNTAGLGLMPLTVYQKVNEFLLDVINYEDGINAVEILDELYFNPMLKKAAKLMKTNPENITVSLQTTDGLKRILTSLTPKKGMKIVSFDLEFPTISAILKSYAKRHGLEVKVIGNKGGLYYMEDVERVIDDNTFAVVFSDVQWITGQRMPTKEIAGVAHEHGAWVIVDAVQSLGALEVYPEKMEVDALVAGGEKWLLNPNTGSGVMWISEELIEVSEPILGLLNTQPEVPWSEWWGDERKDVWDILPVRKDARKLDPGTPPYVSIVALDASLELINSVGIEKIEKHDMKLAKRVREYAYELGVTALGSSQITLLRLGVDYVKQREIVKNLEEKGIVVSLRGAKGIFGIRVSPHLYNTEDDIVTLFDELSKFF
ncbi:aminotransferase class V-fold PLP-dependent enzyme [Pyrococcus furiosus DSM 3638]|nr:MULTISPECIES: aminotransferase class V-fold PLP-dependent enzyme [Pyrococcus]AFN03862.1 aminotransferase [Pyrococcus furiosus COM1]MDK2868809.1 hypothetical protein [Pyrococcus sp.]QEK78727.1 aminotransferase class V-fold PLP-dependent enzyme [Pyrococcus furiosus DSM 3638]